MAVKKGTPGNDTLIGTASADTLFGLGGDDILLGLDGNDRLEGGGGSDTLNGGIGIDTMIGGSGNDSYIVDSTTDTITEAANSGIDSVQAQFSYTLGSNLENLTLTGSEPSDGTGNALNNTLIGNASNNILNGQAGNDKLDGGAGNDTFLGSTGSVGERDTLTGGAGRDTFFLGNVTQAFYDDRNTATAGRGDYALITDFSKGEDVIRLNGRKTDYFLAASPSGIPGGTAIYRNKPTGELDELIAIIQGSSNLNLNGNYFKFTSDEINLSSLNGSNGFKINGIDGADNSGYSVNEAGDVNGDGFDDIIIGAPSANSNGQYNAGSSYVVFGKQGGFDSSLNLSTLNGSNGFVINGINAGDYSGISVSAAGDVNGDGFGDIIIGANGADSGQYRYGGTAGSSYVVFGKQGGFGSSLNLSTLTGSNGFVINGINRYDNLGRSVSSAGDVNGDGFDDIIIGASGAIANAEIEAGSSYVVFGKQGGFDSNLNPSTLNGSNGFVINGINGADNSGNSVSAAGDLNGDGFGDIIIGAPYADPNVRYDAAGSSYVVFGKQGGFDSSLNLSTLNGSNGFAINGIDARDILSGSVSSAGDVNGDGFDDLIVGARSADPNGQTYAGESYVVFGKAGGFSPNLNLSALNGNNGFVINGIDARDFSGGSVSSAGDVNGDGFDDNTSRLSIKHY